MHHSELRIACAWQRPPSALIPLQMLIACPSPLLAFVDHADVNLGASTALWTHPRDVPRRVVVVDHHVAVILWPQAALLAAATTDVLFEVREPVLNEVHTLPSRTPLWGCWRRSPRRWAGCSVLSTKLARSCGCLLFLYPARRSPKPTRRPTRRPTRPWAGFSERGEWSAKPLKLACIFRRVAARPM